MFSLEIVAHSKFCPETKVNLPMKDVLSADVVPSVLEENSSIVVAKILSVYLAILEHATPPVETGTLKCEVVEVLRSPVLAPSAVMEIPAHRVAAPAIGAKYNFDHWNSLTLEPGHLLLLACLPGDTPIHWNALAAQEIQSPSAPEVGAVRQCLAIESFAGPHEQKVAMLAAALKSKDDIMRRYALEVIARGHVLTKETAIALIAAAITAPEVSGANKSDLGETLTHDEFFNANDKAAGTNPQVIAALAHGLIGETDNSLRFSWAQYLSACLNDEFSAEPAKDHAIRIALIKKTPAFLEKRVEGALAELSHHGDSDEQKIVRSLHKTWQEALAAP